MPQTPKSISVNIAGAPATAYTVPAATTAVLKTALGQNVVGGSSTFTIQKLTGVTYSPLIIDQTPIITPATGGTAFQSRNLIDGPITLSTGDSIVVSDSASAQFKFPQTSSPFTPTETNSYIARNMLFGNGIYVMVLTDQTNSKSMIVRSTDANTWTEIATGNLLPSANTYYMARNGSTWVVAQWNSSNYMYSTDNALTWTANTVPSSALIYDVEGNGTTFVFCTSLGLYTATTLPTLTLNTAYNNLLGIALPNGAYSPQVASWNGTYWFISNWQGTYASTDLSTYTAMYQPTGGAYPAGGLFSTVTWSSAYSRYYGAPILGGASQNRVIITSSTNGFTWANTDTGINTFSSGGKMVSAGSNTVLLAQHYATSDFLKSTNGTTWSTASAIRGSTYNGNCEGLSNGTFLLTQASTTGGNYYISTDPTSVNGTLFSNATGTNTIFISAASNGTGWFLLYYDYVNGGAAYVDWGPNSTTRSGTGQISTLPSGSSTTQVLWWNAIGRYVVLSNTRMWTNTDGSNNFTQYTPQYASGSAQGIVVNDVLYVIASNATNNVYSLTAAQFNTNAAWTVNPIITPMYSSAGPAYTNSLPNGSWSTNRALSSNGTDILFSGNTGGCAVMTPSVGFNFRTPGAGGLFVERVNNLDIVYTGRTTMGNTTGLSQGFFYGSNIFTTLPTSSTSVGSVQFCNGLSNSPTANGNQNFIGNRVLFYGGAYYAAPDGSNTLSYAPTNIKLFTSYTVSSASVGGVNPVAATVNNFSQNRFQTDGTNFLTYNNASTRIAVYKDTAPANTLASSTMTLGLVEIT